MAGKRKSKSSPSEAPPSNSASANKLKRTEEPIAKEEVAESMEKTASPRRKLKGKAVAVKDGEEPEAKFLGKPVKDTEARKRWPKRYLGKMKQVSGPNNSNQDEDAIQARGHYIKAEVDGRNIFDLYDDAHVQAGDGNEPYVCKIVEMFEAIDGTLYFTAQWYYRSPDTVIKECATIDRGVDQNEKSKLISTCKYFCDTTYLLPYSTFMNLPEENIQTGSDDSTISSEADVDRACEVNSEGADVDKACQVNSKVAQLCPVRECGKPEVTLLDLYSGCGAMSTGLCLGAQLSNVNLVTRWAVDVNEYACQSLKLNHPETEVRNESAEDFLSLLKEWRKLCFYFNLVETKDSENDQFDFFETEDEEEEEEDGDSGNDENDSDDPEFEVDYVLEVCYGDPNKTNKRGLYFKIRWKGYGDDEDTWEPIDGLGHCRKAIGTLFLNGDVDVVCGGPPCQGISGFNRFRNTQQPLEDEKNKQLIVFMDFVQYLNPKFVLMENVVDIVKFSEGLLGRYALDVLLVAYGLPQFRMRMFMWGARPTERLPQYPLPTHDVVVRGVIPTQFEGNTVAYDEGGPVQLERKLLLEDAISDLPAVENSENRMRCHMQGLPRQNFRDLLGSSKDESLHKTLYDHRPLELNADDYARGANFRDLPGVRVRVDNKVEWDPDVERVYLKSGKPLVPDYAMSFVKGSSSKPFARLWWDETVPTVVTRAEPHNQAILHPVQDRVLSIRENARLQGFPDYYKLCGPVKERYIQVGNAVAVPVARALGYALGLALKGSAGVDPVFPLPEKFPNIQCQIHSASSEDDA
ncbi:chromomethylase 3 [Prunus dulcis]|uniref:DNA (cytosine-5-)-methyltransferase n=1 Tax=Prunus dulcis TaxID=3755 RepID=A0A4Y1RKB4_PRUDU|nr:chromomethylase 3 [Prunus dulcis]